MITKKRKPNFAPPKFLEQEIRNPGIFIIFGLIKNDLV
jgi:hypothetical protein